MATPSVGQRLSYDGALCTVRYVGPVAGTGGTWLGVEWDDPRRGKHDGVHKDVRYFSCKRGGATAASFVRPTRPADPTRTFLEAVRAKYAEAELPSATSATSRVSSPHVISGKVAEEVGFDKVRRQLAQIETLRVVILDGMCVTGLGSSGESVRTLCPSITDLDLSRNLFTDFATVAAICRELPGLRSLRVNGVRFAGVLDSGAHAFLGAFDGVKELALEETFLSWAEIGRLTTNFPALASLAAGSNQLPSLVPPLPAASTLPSTLTSLSLEFNSFTALSDLACLAGLHVLRNLHLKGCSIAEIAAAPADGVPTRAEASLSPSLRYLDLSYNRVATWAFVDALPDVFPGMTALRFSHNPIYNSPYLDADGAAVPAASSANAAAPTEESYMFAVGRLGGLRTLNFSTIAPTDRANAEMFYLSRIAKQLATAAEGSADEAAIKARHRRYAELCELYGEPAVVRHTEINPAFLEARLVTVDFCLGGSGDKETECRNENENENKITQRVQIPKSFDMYAVKSIAGRLFGRSPQQLRLVWETGEWDPVGGEDEGEDDEDEMEEREMEEEKASEAKEPASISAPGRWIKREAELKDSPRQFGLCVDGMEVRLRVEVK